MGKNSYYYGGSTNIREAAKAYFQMLTIKDKVVVSILLVILVLVFIMVQKLVTLSMIVGRTKQYERMPNAYQEIINDVSNEIKKYEIFKKDEKVKTVATTRRNSKTVKYYDNNKVNTVEEDGTSRTLTTKNIANITTNFFGPTTLADMITDCFKFKLDTEQVETLECYVISGIQSSDAFYVEDDVEKVKLYIAKKTDLPVKIVEELQNGKIRITSYRYEFDVVTDKDVAMQGVRR